MRVLLLGATGNLGLRLIPSLLSHNHQLTVFVRNPSKLRSLLSPSLYNLIHAVVIGDATDVPALEKAIIDHDIEGIVDVAGNQVLPWREYILPKIAKAAADAAVVVGRKRERPLRIWVTSGLFILKIPGADVMISDYFPRLAIAQHDATRAVIECIPTADLNWSIIAVSGMNARDPKHGFFQPLEAPQPHRLLASATVAPVWRTSWVQYIPVIGMMIHGIVMAWVDYRTEYEDMADFLAEDLEIGSGKWVGKKVGVVDVGRKDV